MVVLYGRTGESLVFSDVRWQEVLATAKKYGWQPQGTASPPSSFDLDAPGSTEAPWDGNYSRPTGQFVLPKDALNLSEAIQLALNSDARWKFNSKRHVQAFVSLGRDWGFVISDVLFISTHNAGPDTKPDYVSRTVSTLLRAAS